jgi:hypothetical protein
MQPLTESLKARVMCLVGHLACLGECDLLGSPLVVASDLPCWWRCTSR